MKPILSVLLIFFGFVNLYAQSDKSDLEYTKGDEVFKVVEQMPRFPGCEDQGLDDKTLKDCSNEKMSRYIFSKLKYPAKARQKGTQGKAIIQFVVKKDGKIRDVKLLRDPGDGCGAAAKQVIDTMSDDVTWIPGKQRGRRVNVLYTLPIDFKL